MSLSKIAPPREISESAALFAGGTSGVGLASALHFAQAGVPRITLVGRDQTRGDDARQKVAEVAPGCDVHFISANLIDLADCQRAVDEAYRLMGRIDVLVNTSHAGTVPSPFTQMPPEEIEPMLTRHLLGQFYACRLVMPYMQEQKGGSIINLSSDAAKIATPGEVVMGGCMAAILMFTRTLALEAKRDGIRVNALTPSMIVDTPSYDAIMGTEFGQRLFGKVDKMAGLGLTSAEDQAETILFLASPASAKLTGQAISVNGGISAA